MRAFFSYLVNGRTINSQVALPQLVAGGHAADVKVRISSGNQLSMEPPPKENHYEITGDSARLSWKDVGTFVIQDKREVLVYPLPNVGVGMLQLLLLGPVLAVLLKLRGHLVLHASGVMFDDGAVAFLGASGWGKSILAAALHARALLQRPELLAAQHALTAQSDRLRAARAAYVPSISVAAQTYSGTSSPPLGQTGSQVGVTATLPLVDGGSRSAQISQAEIGYARAQVLYDRARLSVERDVANAVREYESAQTQLTAATAGLQDAQAQLRIARLRERSGKAIELETLDALTTQATARENLSLAIARYDDALAIVHHAAGDYSVPLSKGVK